MTVYGPGPDQPLLCNLVSATDLVAMTSMCMKRTHLHAPDSYLQHVVHLTALINLVNMRPFGSRSLVFVCLIHLVVDASYHTMEQSTAVDTEPQHRAHRKGSSALKKPAQSHGLLQKGRVRGTLGRGVGINVG